MNKFKLLVLILFVLLAGFLTYRFYQNYSADVLAKYAANNIETYDYKLALKQISLAIKKNPSEPKYLLERAKVYLLLSVLETKPTYKLLVMADLKNAEKLNPKNLVTLRNELPLYYYLSVNDVSQPAGEGNIDNQYLSEFREFSSRLKHDYAGDAGVLVLIGEYEKKLGLASPYIQTREMIKKLRPDLLEWRLP